MFGERPGALGNVLQFGCGEDETGCTDARYRSSLSPDRVSLVGTPVTVAPWDRRVRELSPDGAANQVTDFSSLAEALVALHPQPRADVLLEPAPPHSETWSLQDLREDLQGGGIAPPVSTTFNPGRIVVTFRRVASTQPGDRRPAHINAANQSPAGRCSSAPVNKCPRTNRDNPLLAKLYVNSNTSFICIY